MDTSLKLLCDIPLAQKVMRRIWAPDRFLRKITGLIHIGANTGQERYLYHNNNLRVLWIEPIPSVFDQLVANILRYPEQKAIRHLVSNEDGREATLHIANNNGASSSLLELKDHKAMWPDIDYTDHITMSSITLPSLIREESIPIDQYQALILDTQGSELLILKGALPIIHHFNFIKVEVPNYEAYRGCCQINEMNAFMQANGYTIYSINKFADNARGFKYYDVVYRHQ